MLPEGLSTDLTSLVEGEDRLAVVMEISRDRGRRLTSKQVYRAVVHNRAKLDYEPSALGSKGAARRTRLARVEGLEEQVRLQDEVAQPLHAAAGELRRAGA